MSRVRHAQGPARVMMRFQAPELLTSHGNATRQPASFKLGLHTRQNPEMKLSTSMFNKSAAKGQRCLW